MFDRAAGMAVVEITFEPAQPQINESVNRLGNAQRIETTQRIKKFSSVGLFLSVGTFFREEIIFGSRIFLE